MNKKMRILGKYPTTRLRRVRSSDWIRRLVAENTISPDDFILPIFLTEGKNKKEKIPNMPGIFRYSVDNLSQILNKASKYKIPMIAVFPNTQKSKKNNLGTEALNEKNLVCSALKIIKKRYNNFGVMCDVALDPYTNHGHDGIVKNKLIDNDETIKILIKQASLQAEFGCDVIAPSDMMDGRIGEIRKALDKSGYQNTKILSYAVKYASNFYGPFRNAVGSNKILVGDKKTYQMDFKNSEESLREIAFDINEGADFVMVKPGLPYLDIISQIKNTFKIPVFSYQVSGEYSILKEGIKKKIINKDAILESLISLKRAGSNAIVTYFALDICEQLKNN
jgi:porphobilinogen synthase